MAAPLAKHDKSGKLLDRRGDSQSFVKDLENVVKQHHFNYAIDIVTTNKRSLNLDMESLCRDQKSYVVYDIPAAAVIDPDLIGAFINEGNFSALSHGRQISSDDCLAILPTGHLILHVTSDTYIQLGLEGRPSWYNKLGMNKYVVNVDLTAKCFVPGKKNYQRISSALTRSRLKFNLLVTWEPKDNELCPSSLQRYFHMKGFRCCPLPVQCRSHCQDNIQVPTGEDLADKEQREEFFEWLGAVANQIDLSRAVNEFISTYHYTDSTVSGSCLHFQATGFFSTGFVQQLLHKIRSHASGDISVSWVGVTVHGFQDAPVSWGNHEHGYTNCGDNLYTFVLFPSGEYLVYKAFGCHTEAS